MADRLEGKYDGAAAIERAFEDFQAGKLEDNKTGIMVHYVIAKVDRGEPILVKEIECREGEDSRQPARLQEREIQGDAAAAAQPDQRERDGETALEGGQRGELAHATGRRRRVPAQAVRSPTLPPA